MFEMRRNSRVPSIGMTLVPGFLLGRKEVDALYLTKLYPAVISLILSIEFIFILRIFSSFKGTAWLSDYKVSFVLILKV